MKWHCCYKGCKLFMLSSPLCKKHTSEIYDTVPTRAKRALSRFSETSAKGRQATRDFKYIFANHPMIDPTRLKHLRGFNVGHSKLAAARRYFAPVKHADDELARQGAAT